MQPPVLLAVDDEPQVLNAVDRDMRKRFSGNYRIMKAGSGAIAIETVRKLKERGDRIALFLVDQRMPGMSGIEFLDAARRLYPNACRVLLTAYADTDAAISAINTVRLNHYLLKPWNPPEQNLYPVLEDLLESWRAEHDQRYDGLTLIGRRWAPESHRIKDFLSRNLVPFRYFDASDDPEAASLLERTTGSATELPVLVFSDGSFLVAPTIERVAERIGLKTSASVETYDLAVVGAGPAGLAAAVYGASEGLETAIIEREAPGGQAGTSSKIENYLGFPEGLSGADLTRRAVMQAKRFGAEIVAGDVTGVRTDGAYHIVRLAGGSEIGCRALLIATGVIYRKLDIPGADRLTGAGVYYGASLAEALSVRDEDVYLVGGGNSAGQAAMHFANYCEKVTILIRRPGLEETMSRYLIDQLDGTDNIHVRPNTVVNEVHGEKNVEAITLLCTTTGEKETVPTCALFIFIGARPHTDWLDGFVRRDSGGFILSGPDLSENGKPPQDWPLRRAPFLLEASVPGVFVAGDVRHRSIKRVAAATGEGAMCVHFVHQHLAGA